MKTVATRFAQPCAATACCDSHLWIGSDDYHGRYSHLRVITPGGEGS